MEVEGKQEVVAERLVAQRDEVVRKLVTRDKSVLCHDMGKLTWVNGDINWGIGFWKNNNPGIGGAGVVYDIMRKEVKNCVNKDGIVVLLGGWGSTAMCLDGLMAEILNQAGEKDWYGIGITASPIASDWTLVDPSKFKSMNESRKLVRGMLGYLNRQLGGAATKFVGGHSMWGHGVAREWADLIKGVLPYDIAKLYENTKFMAIAGVAQSGDHVTLTQDLIIKIILSIDPERKLLDLDRSLFNGGIAKAKFGHFLGGAADFPVILANHLHTFNNMPGLAELQTKILDETMVSMIGGQTVQMVRGPINPMTLICMDEDRVLTSKDQHRIAELVLKAWELNTGTLPPEQVIKIESFKSGHYWNNEAKRRIAQMVAKDLTSGKA